MDPKVVLICDLQFGSTGKGLIAGYLARNVVHPDAAVCAWAPNAGHTFITREGVKYVHRMLPNSVAAESVKAVYIGPGAVIDLDLLAKEIEECGRTDLDVYVHQHAAYVKGNHVLEEQRALNRIGSTQKGTAAANIEKMMRGVDANIILEATDQEPAHELWDRVMILSPRSWSRALVRHHVIMLEGAQGFSLGINSGIYPYTTSRECTPAQMMSDCALPLPWLHQIVGTLRTYPIRVANRFDADGNMVGYSGPGYDDQQEIAWQDIGVEPELTTVTQLPRRVFTFSFEQLKLAYHACRPDFLFLNFANYLESAEVGALIHAIAKCIGRDIVKWTGWGPTEDDIHPRYVPYNNRHMSGTSIEALNRPEHAPIIKL